MTMKIETTLTMLALTQIKPGTNPRTEFDQAKLEELAQSLKDDGGAVQPVVVYLDDDGLYGLIAGERRWRASKLAGLETVEAIVRPKPAVHEARKKALKENMQREDLTPLEIARAVHDMLAEENEYGAAIYSRSQLADELGKNVNYIAWCEALLRCSDRLQKRVHLGQTPLEVAALIGSLPSDMHEMAERDIVMGPHPMTRDAAREHIAEKYRKDLRKAQFDQADGTLVEGKPACQQCEFWGGKREDVQGKNRVHICLNPACYERKQLAFVSRAANASAEGHGVQMLGETERGKVFSFDGVTVKGDSGYVAADESPDKIMLVDPKATVPVWGKIVEGSDIPCVKIMDGEGRLRTLYDARLAVQVATAQPSAVKALFKAGKAASGTATVASQVEVANEAAKEKAKATGLLASGRNWVTMIRDGVKGKVVGEIEKLIYERLTEAVDREWMAKVLDVKNPLEYEDGKGSAEVLGLALIARTLRLQGPPAVHGIAGDLAKMIGFDGKKEAKAIEALVATVEKAGSKEQLFTCEVCGQANFTKRGLAAHNCEKRQKVSLETGGMTPVKFVEQLMTLNVAPAEPNENGVFLRPNCGLIVIKAGKQTVEVSLAQSMDGRWATGYAYESKALDKRSGGGLPRFRERIESRYMAVLTELRSLIDHFSGLTDFVEMVEKLKAADTYLRCWLPQTVDVAEPETKLVPANAAPEVEKFAKENGMVLMKTVKARGGKREKNGSAEQIALKTYLKTGSIAKAATACGLDVESVKNWHKRRGWKALREAESK